MADVAALGSAEAARLPDREGREVVVVPVVLLGLEAERVEAHLLLERAERDDAERLRLAAREERRAVRARRDADLDRDVADLVRARGRRDASCATAMRSRMIVFSSLSKAICAAARRSS